MVQIRSKSSTLQVMSILVRLLEKTGIFCAWVYVAWLNFIDPMCAYLAGDGWLPALIVSISAGLLGTACAVYLTLAGPRRTGYGS
jgi:hypothetical protein